MVQVLTNKLISTIRLLVIRTICTKQVEGFCWLFLPNLLNRLKISILQKQKEKKNASASEMTQYYVLKGVTIWATERK